MIRRLKYVITNLVNVNTLCCVYSEDEVYAMENLYNGRPSKPYRSTDVGAPGTPEWICVSMASKRMVTFIGIFNHNLTMLEAAGDELTFKGCDLDCESPVCNWDAPDDEIDISGSLIEIEKGDRATFENLYYRTRMRRWNFRLDIIDQNNSDGYIEIGEYFLGMWEDFSNHVVVTPGRADSPAYFKGDQQTFMGQDWMSYYSKTQELTLNFKNLNDRDSINEVQVFLDRVQEAGGAFVLVPDYESPICFYVKITDFSAYGLRTVYGEDGEMKTWSIPLKTLTTGIRLL